MVVTPTIFFKPYYWLQQVLFMLLAMCALSVLAEEARIIDQIKIEDAGDKTRIRINFNLPLQYINHVPPAHGDKIVVQLRPIVARQTEEFDFSVPESMSWEPTPDVPLQFVRFEGGTAQSVQIGIYFINGLDYEVQPSSDARSMSILIAKAETPPEPSVSAPVPAPGKTTIPAKPRAEDMATLPALSKERLDALMEEARQVIASGDYPRGIQIYTKILQHQDTGKHQEAQEFLAYARERNGQLAQAKMAYEIYLQRFPKGPGADRVRQRLAGLKTARMTPKGKLRATEREQAGPYLTVVYSVNSGSQALNSTQSADFRLTLPKIVQIQNACSTG